MDVESAQIQRQNIPACVPVITRSNPMPDPARAYYPTDEEVKLYMARLACISNEDAITNRERYLLSIVKRIRRDILRVRVTMEGKTSSRNIARVVKSLETPDFTAEFSDETPPNRFKTTIQSPDTEIINGYIVVKPNPTLEPHERFPYVPTEESIQKTADGYAKVCPDPLTPREQLLINILENARIVARKVRTDWYNSLPRCDGWMSTSEMGLDARFDCEDLFDEFLHEVGNINIFNFFEVIPPGKLCSLLIYFGYDMHVVWRPRDGSIQKCLEWTRHGEVHMCGGFIHAQNFCLDDLGDTHVEKWFNNGLPHNVTNYESNRYGGDLPSHWERWDYREWRINGVLSRKNNECAVINPLYEVAWFIDGLLSRPEYPAMIWSDGCLEYWEDGKRHKIGGPAVTWRNYDERQDEYWVNGMRFNVDGSKYDWSIHHPASKPQPDPSITFTYCGEYRLGRNLGHIMEGQFGYSSDNTPYFPPAGHVDADAGYFSGHVDAFGNYIPETYPNAYE